MATVLIVDDNLDICRVMARLVRAMGHAADIVPGGQEAIDYLASHRPDAVILDFMMPRVDGLDVLRAVRQSPRTADVPVIMFTAAGEGELRERAMRQGASGFWVKGCLNLDEFDNRLSAYLRPTG